jgi:long-chain acyl-CoA synthetase
MPKESMRPHLATLLDDFRRIERDIAVVRMQGVRRRVATYGDIARQAGRFAALLEQRGIGIGDRVVLWAENSAEWVAAFYGMLLRGALAVPLDAYGSADFAARVCADVKPKLVVGDAALLRRLTLWHATLSVEGSGRDGAPGEFQTAEAPETPWPTLAFEEWADSLPSHEAAPAIGLDHNTPLQILFTSGTTGEPKGIVHTHGNVLASVDPIEQGAKPYMRYERVFHPVRFLHTLPLSHVYGQTMGLWVPAIFAAEVHFESRLVAPRLIETIKGERISVLAAVPRVMALLKAHLEATTPGLAERIADSKGMNAAKRWWVFRDVHRALGLKFWALISGGGALPGPLEQFWNGLGLVVVQGYGMTETTALITLNHPFHVASGTIGKPLPDREVKIGPDGEVLVRGPMISNTTWSGGALKTREEEWLATGDLAEKQASGELRFLGRKSEVIVTAAGINIHPEDLEGAIEQEAGVLGCAVVALETANGPEPFAVLAVRGAENDAATAVEHANARLAEFQRIVRWAIWPEPDLPRTSTGKVRRKAVAAWAAEHAYTTKGAIEPGPNQSRATEHGDWLYALVAAIAGENPEGGDELKLNDDFHLDSLGRVQLAATLEERLGSAPGGTLDEVRTLGELRALAMGKQAPAASEQGEERRGAGIVRQKVASESPIKSEIKNPDKHSLDYSNKHLRENPIGDQGAAVPPEPVADRQANAAVPAQIEQEKSEYLYPHWPWSKPAAWTRALFLELIAQPLIWFLAKPRVIRHGALSADEPMLVIGNHVTAFDGPLIQYALPGTMRRRMAVAMSGEMLEDYRHFRNPDRASGTHRFMLFGPLAYFLVTALYNVFPLPRRRNFQRSFAHAGEALDRGMHVMVFPEGTRSEAGELARFRPGIGLLVKQAQAPVLPIAVRGLGELKRQLKGQSSGWFRSGTIEVHVGEAIEFGPGETEAAITARLNAEVRKLLGDSNAERASTESR